MCKECVAERREEDLSYDQGFSEGYNQGIKDAKAFDYVIAVWMGVGLLIVGFGLGRITL